MARHGRRGKGRRSHNRNQRSSVGPTGRIEIHTHGYAFCDTDEGSFYIPAKRTGGAMPGDLVMLRPQRSDNSQNGKRLASVSRVISRATEYLVGILEINDPLAVVVAQDPRVHHDLFVTEGRVGDAKDGDVVLAKITSYPERHTPMQGHIVEVLGQADDPGIDVDIVIHNLGIPTEFSSQALQEAQGVELDVQAALEDSQRKDLRERDVFTIDPVDAKDFDDAISFDAFENGIRLGVHIADVSQYVAWGSSIDLCARDRGCSVYLVDRVIPMLPEVLSNDVCSLKPGVDRLTMTCDMYVDNSGRVMRYEIFPSIIRSHRRFNYGEVQEILEGSADDPYKNKLREFDKLAKLLFSRRIQRGAVDFDSVEAKPVLDDAGAVEHIEIRVKTDATAMIEEAMILANETVAAHMFKHHHPLVYRIHEAPSAASLEALLPTLKELGYAINGLGAGEPRAFQNVLDQARGRPEEALVNYVVLRAMERARYSTQALPHFGLASEHYCHFTSPIRRYPDLMVHRLLKDPSSMEGQLDWLAQHSSKMERLAEEAERDSVELKLCVYMEQRIGDIFIGTISAVVSRGFFVRLDNTAEGMVRFDYLHGEYHHFDAKTQTLVGEESGRTYRLGQQVRVRLAFVDVRERDIQFEVV